MDSHGLPYSELMTLTLMSSPLEAFATSIFFDQLRHFSSSKSLQTEKYYELQFCFLKFPKVSVLWFSDCTCKWKQKERKYLIINLESFSREFLKINCVVIWVANDQGDIVMVWSCSPALQLCLVFKGHLDHNFSSGTAVPGKLQNKTDLEKDERENG